jgi:hypothetical protein
MDYWPLMAKACEILACLFLGALGVIVLFKVATNKIDLEWLISEDNGHASMARFQLLVFTFVVAISFVKLVEMKDQFPEINSGVLTLLGISASTYAVGKGIQKSGEDGEEVAPNTPKVESSRSLGRKAKASTTESNKSQTDQK